MNRRTFISLSAVTATAIAVPYFYCRSRSTLEEILRYPPSLAESLDEKTLYEMGVGYRQLFPEENEPGRLKALLLQDEQGQPVSPEGRLPDIEDLLEQKTIRDFATGHTIIVNGWVLSRTEARQCALYSLSLS